MPWYKERHLTNISLGSLVLLCVLRVVVYNINRARDSYLLSNCSAILLNLAAQVGRRATEFTHMVASFPRLMSSAGGHPTGSQSKCPVVRTRARITQAEYACGTRPRLIMPSECSWASSMQAERIHEYTAVRLINVLTIIMRRYVQHVAREESSSLDPSTSYSSTPYITTTPSHSRTGKGSPPLSSSRGARTPLDHGLMSSGVINAVLESSTTRSPSHPSLLSDDPLSKDLLIEALRVLLTVFNICLRPTLVQSNIRLVHYLMYSKRELDPYIAHPRIIELGWLGNVPMIMEHFSKVFDEEEETLSVGRAMDLLEKGARQLSGKMRAQMEPEEDSKAAGLDADVKFTYEVGGSVLLSLVILESP